MVKRVLTFMYKEVQGLHQAAYVLGLFAFGSQLLALVRDRLLAHQFGAGAELDLYYAAFRIPDLLYVLFASTLSVYVLIPFVSSRIKGDDASEARVLLSQIFTGFVLVYTLLALLVFISAPLFVPWLFPGLQSQSHELTSVMRILLLQPLFLGISSLLGVITQLGHRFILYAISPLLYNIGIIIGISVLYPLFGLNGLAYGVVLGAIGHMLVQVPLIRSGSLAFWFTTVISWSTLAQILKMSIPRAFTLALGQLTILALISLASVMETGSVSVFQFAFNLQSVPLAIIGASYSIAAFPYLSDLYAQKKMEAFGLHVISALRHIIFWSVPAIALLIVLRAHVVRVVLGSGAFSWADTRLTAAVLALLSLSLLAQAINLLIVRAFYAGGHTRAPLLVSLFGSIFSVVLCIVLYNIYLHDSGLVSVLQSLLRIEDVQGSEIIVVGLGYTIAICLQTLCLTSIAVRTFSIPMQWFLPSFGRACIASIVGGCVSYATLNLFVGGINDTAFTGILIQGALGGVMGIIAVMCTYYVLRSPEMKEIYISLHTRLFKVHIIAPQEDVL